ncbi:Beta-ketoadipate enol-lactone hydrolase [Pseudonocardia sp. Ae717_Ps2]|uniref:alpha/beta fold hydrolase n=1 Tax=unclassified Pseudonocardia TaxID=2619320 RepID=UPI00094AB654|nr:MULTISPECIES: alpha/beta hydrolase [unclassified Pseudonocardia]OLM11409.1 Beta-ketoadipate enol-lactone hydrolase [Pseudonocardia sp. Ae505_Ps2]OLM34515.1 Beta-ketoadipate enol-lactone hydrolase [Pseudonocardia sp. Ae717_Ps2]
MTGPLPTAVRSAGSGDPVLLLHGIGGAAASFDPQLAGPLADRYRLLAWDAPGYGDSPDPVVLPGTDPMDLLADSALAVLERAGGPAHVVGVSWGGVIATRMALRRPELLRSLTLADSTRGSGRTAAGRSGMTRRVEELATLGARAFAALRAPRLVGPDADPQVLARVTGIMSGVRTAGYTLAAAAMAATDHSAQLSRIDLPALVVVGEHDVVTGVAESRALAEGITGAGFAVVAGAGHAANQERPAAFDRILGGFLAGVRPATAVAR